MPAKRPLENRLYCFSPLAMIVTYGLETALAFYVSMRCPASRFRAIVISLLLCLAVFQLVEFEICEGSASLMLAWTKLGLVAITLLPALGMHLVAKVTRTSWFVWTGYAFAVAYGATFVIWPGAVKDGVCHGNYVILDVQGGALGLIYELYYAAFMLLAVLELVLRLTKRKSAIGFGFSRRLIWLTLIGYMSFILPMAAADLLSPTLREATPSVMCGFAVGFALLLALWIAPLYARESLRLKEPGLAASPGG